MPDAAHAIVFAGLLAGAALAPAGDLQGLLSACADGDLAMCRQLDAVGEHAAVSGSPALDARAGAFAAGLRDGELVEDGVPALASAYPRVIKDYFASEGVTDAERARWLARARLPECAAHYQEVWLQRRRWWPVTADDRPHWKLIYVHMLDHYFGYCVDE